MEAPKHIRLIKDSAITLFILVLIAIGIIGYGYYRYQLLTKNFVQSNQKIDELENTLAEINAEKSNLSDQLAAERYTNESFQGQIAGISNTVGTLKKLKETDKELLQKYSKVYFLNENYLPLKLIPINPEFALNKDKVLHIHVGAEPFFNSMIAKANSDGVHIKVISAYRSFGEQAGLKSNYKVTYGAGSNKFSADQGYSEHQLGTTLDLTTEAVGATFNGFEKSEAYTWLTNHAYEYGFILSYPKDNTFYQFEPWHWRFVGKALARTLHEENKHFYDLDQREIDKYLVNIFD